MLVCEVELEISTTAAAAAPRSLRSQDQRLVESIVMSDQKIHTDSLAREVVRKQPRLG